MNKKSLKGNIFLLVAAFLWGMSFVAQDVAIEHIETFTMNGIRSIIGTLSLLPLILIRGKKNGIKLLENTKARRRDLLLSGLFCGLLLAIATNLQQFGIALYPDGAAAAGRSGFITALYVVLVPLCGIFMKKKIALTVWLGVVLATLGLFLLCFSSGIGSIYLGDLIVLMCAFAFCGHILCVDRFSDKVDGIKLSALQFFVCGIISLILMAIFNKPTISGILAAAIPILYVGIFSCGVAYTLQILGQQNSNSPTVASILMSMESLFAVLGGAVILKEQMGARETVGCLVMFAAIILSQLPPIKLKKKA